MVYHVTKKMMVLSLIMGALFVGAMTASAQGFRAPANKQLEVSLLSLRETAQEINQRNAWIKEEMEKLQGTIKQMTGELALLEEHKKQLEGGEAAYEEAIKNLSLVEKQIMRANMSMGQLESERRRLQAQLNLKAKRELQLKEQIGQLSKEVSGRISQTQAKEVSLTGKSSEINKYRMLLEKSVKSLERAEHEYNMVLRKYERPLQVVERLKRQRSELQQQTDLLQDELKISFEEETILKNQILEIKKDSELQVGALEEEISRLENRGKELQQVLVKAKTKIEHKNLQLETPQEAALLLEENLNVIQRENLALQKQVSGLKSTLQKIEAK